MFPLTRIIYMPLSSSTTLLTPIPTDYSSSSSTISIYNPTILNNSLPISNSFEQKFHRSKRIHNDYQQRKRLKSNDHSKNALMLLYDIQPSVEYKLIGQRGPPHRPTFTMSVEIHGKTFHGTGQTKKDAKQAAAEKALRSFSKLEQYISNPSHILHPIKRENTNLSDRITICIQEKFNQLTEHDVRLQRRKVLSGIVLTENLQSMKIICLTTGTKSIHNDHQISSNGHYLNDCHAEILARRCLIRYCYEQLRLLINEKFNETIFEKIDGTNRIRMKSSYNFHLYISTVPCGDSRIFSLQDIYNNEYDKKYSVKKSQGLLRRKIGINEGTIPILAKTIYPNMDICNNDEGQFVTMSCSDKLCRWNFIGLQGALLSRLIEPIYLTSIIIGSVHRTEHLRQSLFARIEKENDHLSTPYGLRRPMILGVSHPEMRNTIRSSHYALIWNCIDEQCELIDTFTGMTITHELSSISKIRLFQQWKDLISRMKFIEQQIPMIYSEAKQSAQDYQKAKLEVIKAFEKNGLGQWIRKPFEYDAFNLS